MHKQMNGGGCASYHGADREGQRLWPQFGTKAPPLTADALFGDDAHKEAADDHGTPPVNRYIVPGIEFADLNLRIPGLRTLPGWCEAPRDFQHTAMYRESYPEPVPDLRHRNSRVIDPCQYSDSLMV